MFKVCSLKNIMLKSQKGKLQPGRKDISDKGFVQLLGNNNVYTIVRQITQLEKNVGEMQRNTVQFSLLPAPMRIWEV